MENRVEARPSEACGRTAANAEPGRAGGHTARGGAAAAEMGRPSPLAAFPGVAWLRPALTRDLDRQGLQWSGGGLLSRGDHGRTVLGRRRRGHQPPPGAPRAPRRAPRAAVRLKRRPGPRPGLLTQPALQPRPRLSQHSGLDWIGPHPRRVQVLHIKILDIKNVFPTQAFTALDVWAFTRKGERARWRVAVGRLAGRVKPSPVLSLTCSHAGPNFTLKGCSRQSNTAGRDAAPQEVFLPRVPSPPYFMWPRTRGGHYHLTPLRGPPPLPTRHPSVPGNSHQRRRGLSPPRGWACLLTLPARPTFTAPRVSVTPPALETGNNWGITRSAPARVLAFPTATARSWQCQNDGQQTLWVRHDGDGQEGKGCPSATHWMPSPGHPWWSFVTWRMSVICAFD